MKDSRSCALSPSQQKALEILAERDPEVTWTSSTNGSSYVAFGSAQKLEAFGLARIVLDERSFTWRVFITDEGRAHLKGKST